MIEPFKFVEREQNAFVNRQCTFRNCFITENPNYFNDILAFDIIMFDSLTLDEDTELPSERSPYQKYVFSAWEPAAFHLLHERYNGYFNLTWTYKLDSDIPLPYVIIKDQSNEVIGPKMDMHWLDLSQMNETSTYIRNKLQKKHIAAACFVSNCEPTDRMDFIYELKKELNKYGHRLDVYGVCGDLYCPGRYKEMEECFARIESDYYFYLAFENSFCADYVSEKLLHALEHFAVPVVLGGANYSR
ncbi:alpha-(1,3)-fucosyltransferase C-like [Hyposmocoma kahamanoa]|uniref:alpha-(1,3)-fucosyltransferase C-like n=1 Tax=Hyposmocoma kahamanoa TaxID=1477025 RepID=UPI000E6D822E|nr:alpha-(1,3)-fucosyltransferase C-like [Hyposmocoma kahamanoa]